MTYAQVAPSSSDEDFLARPTSLSMLPVAAILAIAAAHGTGRPILELLDGSRRVVRHEGLIDRRGRLTTEGESRALHAREWLMTATATQHLEQLHRVASDVLDKVAAGEVALAR